MPSNSFISEHLQLTRRYFLGMGVAGAALTQISLPAGSAEPEDSKPKKPAKPAKAGARSDPYFTAAANFQDVSRGKPVPHTLNEEQRREVGLTRETWKLEVIADPDKPARLGKSLTKADGTAL